MLAGGIAVVAALGVAVDTSIMADAAVEVDTAVAQVDAAGLCTNSFLPIVVSGGVGDEAWGRPCRLEFATVHRVGACCHRPRGLCPRVSGPEACS